MKMKMTCWTRGITGMAAAATLGACSSGHAEWSYSGPTGPENWGEMNEAWINATIGASQSPVDIRTSEAVPAALNPLAISTRSVSASKVDTGHCMQVNCAGGSEIDLGDSSFELVQFHFHAPSEHTVDGQHFAAEAHFVHADENGNLAVVGVLIDEGMTNTAYGELASGAREIDVASFLPASAGYFTYSGSLTTPPATEGVRWFVMSEPVELSAEQIATFTADHAGNNRPVQPLNARTVLRFDPVVSDGFADAMSGDDFPSFFE